MITKDTVERFLKDFKEKTKTLKMQVYPRDVNMKALLELGINALQRQEYIFDMTYANYYKGPTVDNFDKRLPNFWEFGTYVNSTEVYVKLSMGHFNNSTICMSFHPAKHVIEYPLKN